MRILVFDETLKGFPFFNKIRFVFQYFGLIGLVFKKLNDFHEIQYLNFEHN